MGKKWKDLSIKEKIPFIQIAVRNGYTDINDIIERYNKFSGEEDVNQNMAEPVYYGGMSPEVTVNYNPGLLGPGSKLRKVLRTAASNAAIAENPAVMTASGFSVDENGYLRQNPDSEGAKQLSNALAGIGAVGAAMYGIPAVTSLGSLSALNPYNYIGTGLTARNLAGKALIDTGTELGLTTAFPSLSSGNMWEDMLYGVGSEFGGDILKRGILRGYSKIRNFNPKEAELALRRAKTRYITGPIRKAKRARKFL